MRSLVTGASRGLGLGLCSVLAERGDEVLAVCRSATPELQELPVTILEGFDVADDTAMARLANAVGAEPIDLVICNAGINVTYAQGIDDLDVPALKSEFDVNTFGPIRTIKGVLGNLREGSKVALISTYRPGVGVAKRNYGYQMSKIATNQFAYVLADELATRGVATIVLSPGPMETRLLREIVDAGHANIAAGHDPLDVARDLLERLDELTVDNTGAWLFRTGERLEVPTSVWGH